MVAPLLLAVNFMNYTYVSNPCSSNVPVPVAMRSGQFEYFDKKMAVSFYLHVDSVKEGSMQSGTRQAVVTIACDFPVGGTSATYLFAEHGQTATLLGKVAEADWGADWGQGPDSIHTRFANQRLYVSQCKDNQCTKRATAVYALRAGKLKKIGR